MAEAMTEYQMNTNAYEIVILPPPPDYLYDEEEVDEQRIMDPVAVQDVPGQLEVVCDSSEEEDSGLDEPDVSQNWRKSEYPRYTMADFKGVPAHRMQVLHDEGGGLTPIQLFDLM